nr:MAG TPA: hypothetical protein [Caudoviricetes sp.]
MVFSVLPYALIIQCGLPRRQTPTPCFTSHHIGFE